MRWFIVVVLAVHGLIHFLGFAKAFSLGQFDQLSQPIGRPLGVAWLLAGLSMLAAAVLLPAAPRWWWTVGAAALVLSQGVIFTSWSDAKFGTVANVIVLLAVVHGALSQGPTSFRAEYAERVRAALGRPSPAAPVVTEADLARLPEPVAKYVRVSKAVGHPRPHSFRARWSGRIRSAANAGWMSMTAEQVNVLGEAPARFMLIDATMMGVPADVLHAFVDGAATMRVKAWSLVKLADASGPEMTRAETVTLLNDLCMLAPGALVDPALGWEPIDARRATVVYTLGPNTVRAELVFDDAGRLVDFVTDDRLRASPDGSTFTKTRWSTPLTDYRELAGRLVAAKGAAVWHPAEGAFPYVELELEGLEYDVAP